jgi:hypothetical protein
VILVTASRATPGSFPGPPHHRIEQFATEARHLPQPLCGAVIELMLTLMPISRRIMRPFSQMAEKGDRLRGHFNLPTAHHPEANGRARESKKSTE